MAVSGLFQQPLHFIEGTLSPQHRLGPFIENKYRIYVKEGY